MYLTAVAPLRDDQTEDATSHKSALEPTDPPTTGRLINWPGPTRGIEQRGPRATPVVATAEVRMKQFIDRRRVEESRYTAELSARDSSVGSILDALTRAFAEVDEFRESRPAGEPLFIEIRLRA
jgi:hypothetical protein